VAGRCYVNSIAAGLYARHHSGCVFVAARPIDQIPEAPNDLGNAN
jgi:hypothetical protein